MYTLKKIALGMQICVNMLGDHTEARIEVHIGENDTHSRV